MVWDDHGGVQSAFSIVDVSAGLHSDVSGEVGEMPASMRGKSDEKSFIVLLDVGKYLPL